jgi:thymidylate synthase
MTDIVLRDMSEYPNVLRHCLRWGQRRSPRGLPTIDTGFTSIVLHNPLAGGMPLGIGRNLNAAIGAVEAAQLIAGISTTKLVLKLAPQFEQYTETMIGYDGMVSDRFFWGAYGERIKMQAYAQIKKLTTDPDTRQAIITLWDPWSDNVVGRKDYPCTIALQFSIFNGVLDMNTIMRSNDAWLGLPYDVFQFTQLQQTMANALGIETGTYRHTTMSLHLYERNEQDAHRLVTAYDLHGSYATRVDFAAHMQPTGIGRVHDSFGYIMKRAEALLYDKSIDDETESETWYRDLLHPKPVIAS